MSKKLSNDQVILGLKKQIEVKKVALKKSEKFSPVTNCNLFFNGERLNLHILKEDVLVHLICMLTGLAKTATELNLIEKYVISGFNINDWILDLKAKYETLNRNMEEERLRILEVKLHTRLTSETQTEIEINELAKQI